jgi:hypothetical protein
MWLHRGNKIGHVTTEVNDGVGIYLSPSSSNNIIESGYTELNNVWASGGLGTDAVSEGRATRQWGVWFAGQAGGVSQDTVIENMFLASEGVKLLGTEPGVGRPESGLELKNITGADYLTSSWANFRLVNCGSEIVAALVGENILLDGTDSGKSDAGSAVILDASAASTDVGENLLIDSTGGRDIDDRIQLSSTNYNLVPENEGGFVLLNGTDGSSTNAGDELLLELGTLEFLQQNSLNVSLGVASEDGGLVLPISEISLVGAAQATTFDSNLATYDSTIITFDAV